MTQAKNGDTVRIHYTGRLDDETVFDSSEGRDPLEFKIGEGAVIPGFEKAVEGMAVDESQTVKIPCGEAYGPRQDELLVPIPRNSMPDDLKPEPGMHLHMQGPDGQHFPVCVVEVNDETVTVDANHPLAGKDLTFEIKLVEIVQEG